MSALLPIYPRFPITPVSGAGSYVYTADGRRYLDFGSGVAVNAFGHAHPVLRAALLRQSAALWHVSNLFYNVEAERLARRYTELTFADKVFFCNSGAEAMECAIKAARKYHAVNGAPERVEIIGFDGAFHGRTLATLAAAGNPKYLEGFGEPAPGFVQVPFGDHEALKAAIGPRTAAVVIEPVQGEGGVRTVPDACLQGLRALCDAQGVLLVYDEVQCGAGRSGTLFAYMQSGAVPDVLAAAKGIGGGFPLGACLFRQKVADAMGVGSHGTTYGGNPLACAVGNAVIDLLDAPEFLPQVRARAQHWRSALERVQAAFPKTVAGVRGVGLLTGLHLQPAYTPRALADALLEGGLLSIPAGDNTLRLLPPLNVETDELRRAEHILLHVLKDFPGAVA